MIALEIEERLITHLHKRFAGEPRLRVIPADARDVDYGQLVPPRRPFVVAGNLPYFAANPIVRHLLERHVSPSRLS